jgi:hypothetical protein
VTLVKESQYQGKDRGAKGGAAEKCDTRADRQALSGIIRAKPSEASLENPHCEMLVTKVGSAAMFRSKLGAIAQLAKECGGNDPEKHEHVASDELTELLKRLRGGSPA